ncbi:MAG: hypothetical protein E7436_00260 [Ruminococcaceae bacterium]|nr:hypothetical protein [Oscillospiraceae bacterium]
MKKYILRLLIMCLALSLLCGCMAYDAPSGQSMYMDSNGKSWTIDHEAKTVTQGDTVYTFTVTDAGTQNPGFVITYPNGATYYRSKTSEGQSWDYDETQYAPGSVLADLLEKYYTGTPSRISWPNIVLGIFCCIIGFVNLCFPEAAWYLSHMFKAWQYESVEPSDAGLLVTRIGGLVLIILGLVSFFMDFH